jgi:hypothetical protein
VIAGSELFGRHLVQVSGSYHDHRFLTPIRSMLQPTILRIGVSSRP